MTLQEIAEWLSNNPTALDHPHEALRFLNFFRNEEECVLCEVKQDNIQELWENFIDDVETYRAANKRMSDTEKKQQYWDFVYQQLDGMELREYFSAQRQSVKYLDQLE